MLNVLYTIIIYPIEQLIRLVLETSYSILGSYGISLIVVSAAVSVILLPLYHLAEKLQNKDRTLRAEMQPKVDDIKEVYKGYERHLYLKALYREHGYHPLSSLKSSLGLLIQLPFLIAAYHFISGYASLQGVSFSVIADLSGPDGLMHVGGASVNLLPFLMTAVNLAGAYFYARRLPKREGYQMVMVAGVFLVLLYNAPSGVLLYWTCNNIFSFFKYLIVYLKR